MLIRSFDGREVIDLSGASLMARRADSAFCPPRTFVAARTADGRIVDVLEAESWPEAEAACRSLGAVARWSKNKCA